MVGGLVERGHLDQIPAHLLRWITFDQGSEWVHWPTIAQAYGIDAWFCEPHSPWHRGQRWWSPPAPTSPVPIPPITSPPSSTANERRSLGYQSPASLYSAATLQYEDRWLTPVSGFGPSALTDVHARPPGGDG